MPMASKAAALVIFTGSAPFARHCRQKARDDKLLLNEFGLWQSDAVNQDPKLHVPDETHGDIIWKFLAVPDEVALLQRLKIPYVKPHERDRYIKKVMMNRLEEKNLLERPPWHIAKSLPSVIRDH